MAAAAQSDYGKHFSADLFAVSVAGAHGQAATGLMQILSGGSYYQKVYNLAESKRGHESDEDRYVRAYSPYPTISRSRRSASPLSARAAATTLPPRCGWAPPTSMRSRSIPPSPSSARSIIRRPYDDPRVNLSINDARNFFRTADQESDLIVYGISICIPRSAMPPTCESIPTSTPARASPKAFKLLKPDGVLSISFTLVNYALGFKLSKILRELPCAGKPLAVRVLYDYSKTTAFIVRKGGAVTMPNASAFAAIGFTMSPILFSQPYPGSGVPTDDWPFFYMVERAYPFTYMIALGIVLLLSYFFVRRTIGFSDPIDRSYLPFFFLGSGFMLVETKAITELGLHLGGTW